MGSGLLSLAAAARSSSASHSSPTALGSSAPPSWASARQHSALHSCAASSGSSPSSWSCSHAHQSPSTGALQSCIPPSTS